MQYSIVNHILQNYRSQFHTFNNYSQTKLHNAEHYRTRNNIIKIRWTFNIVGEL